MVWAHQLVRSSGPSTVSLKSFWALIWSSQLIGGVSSAAPSAAFLNASVMSGEAWSPAPERDLAVADLVPAAGLLVARLDLGDEIAFGEPRPEMRVAARSVLHELGKAPQDGREPRRGDAHPGSSSRHMRVCRHAPAERAPRSVPCRDRGRYSIPPYAPRPIAAGSHHSAATLTSASIGCRRAPCSHSCRRSR